jgi:LysM repeat protein
MKKKALALLFFALLVPGCGTRMPKTIPMSAPLPASAGGFYHTVARGQTIFRIAKNYGVDPKELMRINKVRDASQLEVGQRLYVPSPGSPATPPPLLASAGQGMSPEDIRHLLGPVQTSSWRTITVHHSATKQGSAKAFDRDHRRRHMGGLFYHFVLDNGTQQTRDGRIEVGWRWRQQVPSNRPNDINICLVGDFSQQQVSQAQFDSLVNLINELRAQYRIPLSAVRKHEDIKGKHTACPGKNFPFHRLIERLSETGSRS